MGGDECGLPLKRENLICEKYLSGNLSYLIRSKNPNDPLSENRQDADLIVILLYDQLILNWSQRL